MKNIIVLEDIYSIAPEENEIIVSLLPEFLEITKIKSYVIDNDMDGKTVISYYGDELQKYPGLEELQQLKIVNDTRKQIKNNEILIENICSKLIRDGKATIVGKELSQQQEERYNEKYILASSGNIEAFIPEANVLGIDAEVLVQAIIDRHDEWKANNTLLAVNVEAFRQYIKKVIEKGDVKLLQHIVTNVNKNVDLIDHTTNVSKLINMLEAEYLQK